MNFEEMLLILIAVFSIAVAAIKAAQKCSVKEAAGICLKPVKDVLSVVFAQEPPPKPTYPVLPGWDGHRVVPRLADADFAEVRGNFASCFCTNVVFSQDGSLVRYQFSIQRRPGSPEDGILGQIIQKQAEEACANTLRCYDCCFPPEPLTLAELYPHFLCVTFARTEDGIRRLDDRKRMLQKRQSLSGPKKRPPMEEDWRDGEK